MSNSWEMIRERSVQKPELPFSLDYVSQGGKTHLFCIGSAHVSVYLVLTILAFVILEPRCHLKTSFIQSAACARKPAQWIELKEGQARFKPHLRRTKIDK